MAITGTCHGCGAVATLFDVESAGVKLCARCVGMQVAFAGEVVTERRAQANAISHDQVHVVGLGSCPQCRARWGWV